jgi:pilus assembly protein CpaF
MLLQRSQPVSANEPDRGRLSVLAEAACAPPDPFAEVKERVYQRLLREIDPAKLTSGDKHEVRDEVQSMAGNMLMLDDVPMARDERLRCASDIADEIVGYGPIEPLLEDPSVTEVMINGPRKVFFEQKGLLHLSDRVFRDDDHIMRIVEKIVVPINRRIDESSPMVDARLPDGSRVNAIIPPLAVDGPTVTIRKFSSERSFPKWSTSSRRAFAPA